MSHLKTRKKSTIINSSTAASAQVASQAAGSLLPITITTTFSSRNQLTINSHQQQQASINRLTAGHHQHRPSLTVANTPRGRMGCGASAASTSGSFSTATSPKASSGAHSSGSIAKRDSHITTNANAKLHPSPAASTAGVASTTHIQKETLTSPPPHHGDLLSHTTLGAPISTKQTPESSKLTKDGGGGDGKNVLTNATHARKPSHSIGAPSATITSTPITTTTTPSPITLPSNIDPSSILVCRNCEDITLPLAVWCTDCHLPEDPSPPVYCEDCNHALHQFAKTKNHVRESLKTIHTKVIAPGESPKSNGGGQQQQQRLEELACSNCDDTAPTIYCTQCRTILCTDCARAIHQPKALRTHTRNPITVKYIMSGYHAASKIHEGEEEEDDEKAPTTKVNPRGSPSISITQLPSTQKADPSLQPTSTPKGSAAAPPTLQPPSPQQRGSFSSSSSSSSNSSHPPTSSRALTKVRRPLDTDTSDIHPTSNPGLPGDVFCFSDPSLSEALNEQQMEFRNVINPYETIGTQLQIVTIVCGVEHTGAITQSGSLFMWGNNHDYQLGCGNILGNERFTRDPLLIEFPRHAPIRSIALGAVHTLALTQTGEVYSWGNGKMGKLGLISDDDAMIPTKVQLGHWSSQGEAATEDLSGQEEVISIGCGEYNSGCVVRGRKDGLQCYIWGEGASGQIPVMNNNNQSAPGQKSSSSSLLPKLHPQLVGIRENPSSAYSHTNLPLMHSISFGTKHVCVLSQAGDVFTFGDNSFGACGYPNTAESEEVNNIQLVPTRVSSLYSSGIKVKSIACGERHTSVLSTTGDIWSFGSGESHQIGILDNIDQFIPQRAVGIGRTDGKPIVALAVGASISAAVTESGETYTWGYGIESPLPKLLTGLKGKTLQSISIGSNANFAVLTGTKKECYEWQFDGTSLDEEETHGVAAGEGGGEGGEHHLSSHDSSSSSSSGHHGGGRGFPRVNTSLRGKKLLTVSSGKNHYSCVTGDGRVYVWGSNHLHECGLKLPGDISFIPSPLELKFPGAAQKVSIKDIKCGVEHSIVLSETGQVYTWGTGFEGRLGHVTNADQPEPKLVQTLVDAQVSVASIAIGSSNTAVISATGSVWMWGANNAGQVGNGDRLPQFAPILLKHLASEIITGISIGNYHTVFLTQSRRVFTTGDNQFGQLGLYPSFEDESTSIPKCVDSLPILLSAGGGGGSAYPVQVECGDNVTLVLTNTGEVYGWGTSETMQLCRTDPNNPDEEQSHEDVPAPVKLRFPFQKSGEKFLRITSLSIRDINCSALCEDGSIWVWGWELGEVPNMIKVKKPKSNANGPNMSPSHGAAAAPSEYVKWERFSLGHTRMLLMNAS